MSVLEIAKISSKSFIVNDGLINITKNTINTNIIIFQSLFKKSPINQNKKEKL